MHTKSQLFILYFVFPQRIVFSLRHHIRGVISHLADNETTEQKPMEEVKTRPPETVVHLKANPGDKFCARCNADLSESGAYTYEEEVYNNPLPGYTNCKAIWAE